MDFLIGGDVSEMLAGTSAPIKAQTTSGVTTPAAVTPEAGAPDTPEAPPEVVLTPQEQAALESLLGTPAEATPPAAPVPNSAEARIAQLQAQLDAQTRHNQSQVSQQDPQAGQSQAASILDDLTPDQRDLAEVFMKAIDTKLAPVSQMMEDAQRQRATSQAKANEAMFEEAMTAALKTYPDADRDAIVGMVYAAGGVRNASELAAFALKSQNTRREFGRSLGKKLLSQLRKGAKSVTVTGTPSANSGSNKAADGPKLGSHELLAGAIASLDEA